MRVLIQNVILPFWAEDEEILECAADKMRRLGINTRTLHFRVYKKSFDARKKNDIKSVSSVLMEFSDSDISPKALKRLVETNKVVLLREDKLEVTFGDEKLTERPLVVGMGPAGLFCALMLAENGYRPIIIDRGDSVEKRARRVEDFYSGKPLDTDSNIQFGAGGAGTFSDGKLVTRINDEKCAYVLDRLYEFGAPEEILVKAKPHIGTDKLRAVVDNILKRIEELGGSVIYRCRLDSIEALADGAISAHTTQGDINCGALVLAVGHSARDTARMLMSRGLAVEAKPFSVGVRIEHLKSDIDRALYGDFAGHPKLGAGEYNLSDTKGGRGVYTFCMCPGGEIVGAASETEGVVVNGMSVHARNGMNSNSAIAVTVNREDYGGTVDGAIGYQRALERAAFIAGGKNYNAPVQTVGDFMQGTLKNEPKRVMPTYMGGDRYTVARLDELLPDYITDALRRGIGIFGRRIEGFDACDAVLSGFETRTSSPLRMLRDDDMTSVGEWQGKIYPCGEGAGYAGGITSAAVDGIKTALKIIEKYTPVD